MNHPIASLNSLTRVRLHLGLALVALLSLLVGCPSSDDDDAWSGPTDDDDDLPDGFAEETFVQATAESSDILFVVDNSPTMEEEQQALSQNIWNFIQFFVGSDLDYHIGTTVLDDGPGQHPIGQLFGFPRYIDANTSDPVGTFADLMGMGTDGQSECDVGLEAAYLALTEPLVSGDNAGFYREQALLNIIVVSDKGDGSVAGCDGIGDAAFVTWLSGLKGADSLESVRFHVISGDHPDGCSSSMGTAGPGYGYHDVYTALGDDHATYSSICETDWSDTMTLLGLESSGLQPRFFLAGVPVASLQVFLDPDGESGSNEEFEIFADATYSTDYAFTYNVDQRSIDFIYATMPPEGASLRVIYEEV